MIYFKGQLRWRPRSARSRRTSQTISQGLSQNHASRRRNTSQRVIEVADPGRCGPPGTAAAAPRWVGATSTSWSSARPTTRPPRPSAGQVDPRRDLALRGPVLHLHHQDAAGLTDGPQGRRGRQGLSRRPRRSRSPRSRAPRCVRSPRPRCPTSTPGTSTPPRRSSPALRGTWASPSPTDVGDTKRRTPAPSAPADGRVKDRSADHDSAAQARSSTMNTQQVLPRPPYRRGRALHPPGPYASPVDMHQSRSPRPRRRPAQGRPDGSRHGQPAPRHRGQDREGPPCSQPATSAEEARAAGADIVGSDEPIRLEEKKGRLDFDAVVSTPEPHGQGRPPRPGAPAA